MRRLLVLAIASVSLWSAACGGAHEPDTLQAADVVDQPPPSVPALPDGTVPWVDWPATSEAFQFGATERIEAPDGADRCNGEMLEGELTAWSMKGDNDEGKPRTTANGLVGFVTITNRGDEVCTLQGAVPVRLLNGGQPAAIGTSHGINDEAEARVTVVSPGGTARIRLDWSAPYCGPSLHDQTIELELPHDGGVLRAPVVEPLQPACTRSETHPDLSSVLSSSAFDVQPVHRELDSPFNQVSAMVEAPTEPVEAGGALVFHVTLTNPTRSPIPLAEPRPGYTIELLAIGDESRPAVTTRSVQFLSPATIEALPPGATRFEMKLPLPDELGAGREAIISWRLLHRALASTEQHYGGFTIRTR